jgi:copper(I)-binding protein
LRIDIMSRFASLSALVLIGLAAAGPAFAHAHLVSSVPVDGETTTTPPGELVLGFSEGVEATLSKVTVTGPDGKPVPLASVGSGDDDHVLRVVPQQAFSDGSYKVDWRVVSVDTHTTQGSFAFKIAEKVPSARLGDLTIWDAEARATLPRQSNSAVYFALANDGAVDDRLVDLATPLAKNASLHRSVTDAQGVASMQPVADGLVIPAHGKAVLSPGGYHVMLTGLSHPLEAGGTLPLILTFAKAGKVRLQVPVTPVGGKSNQGGMPDMPAMDGSKP